MNPEDLPPIDPEIASLLRTAREAALPPPAGAQARVATRLRTSITGGGTPELPAPRARASMKLGWMGAFVVGAVVGAGAMRFASRPNPSPTSFAPVGSNALHTRVNDEVSGPTIPAPGVSRAGSPEAETTSVRAGRAPSTDTFDAERRLLDEARHAFAEGDPPRALVKLHEHETIYDRGTFVEEREALTVRALAAAGRQDADSRAATFRRRYPTSLFGTAVEAATSRAKAGKNVPLE